jgi:transcriptional regulator with XRE-family HTH domain/Tfp pilus assembly protein PilF
MSRERPSTRRRDSGDRKLSKPRSSTRAGGSADLLSEAQISVGNFLRTARESLRLTQAQVADKTRESPWRLSRAAVSAIERGQNFPGLEAMLALSNVLHIDPKELIERARLTAVVPVDITGLSDHELENRASQFFWAGHFKQALSVYDAMVHKLALEAPEQEEVVARLATLEVRRATTLKRLGALISAIASVERAISLSTRLPKIQAEAYVVLADLQAQRGHLPLARDAAERAIELATRASPERLTWAYMVKGEALYLGEQFEAAKQVFLEARRQAETHRDQQHLSHIAGNIANCTMSLGDADEAHSWIAQAIRHAREQGQPALEASWLVESGKFALARGDPQEADRLAEAALKIARPREHGLTVFRAEWLRHHVACRLRPDEPTEARVSLLRELFRQLDEHEGVDEIVEFKNTVLRAPEDG